MRLPLDTHREFGEVRVSVHFDTADCVVSAPRPGPFMSVTKTARFHSLDQIQAAYSVSQARVQEDPTAEDVCKALRWAGEKLWAHDQQGDTDA